MQERARKITELREKGIEPYATKFIENTTATNAKSEKSDFAIADDHNAIVEKPSDAIQLAGRLMTFREHGRISFGQLQDNSGRMQLCFLRGFTKVSGLEDEDEKAHERVWKKLLDLGDYIGVSGDLFRTKHGEITILVHELTMLSKALRPLPEKWHGLTDREKCYRERNLDLLSNTESKDRFTLRSNIVREIREFFYEKDFHEVETRILQPQAGGAMAKVFETHHNALDHDFVLRIALELDLKTACSGGFDRVFEIGKNFRNEGSDPSHLQEFTMLEWYAAYQDLETNKDWTEQLIRRLLENAPGQTEIEVLGHDEQLYKIDFAKPFAVARFPDLLKAHAGLDMFAASDDELADKALTVGVSDITGKGRATLLDDIYKKTARPKLIEPTFVFDYPEALKPLARPKGDGTAECFQLLIGGWEVVNSYGELIDPQVQRRLFEEQSAAKAAGDDEAMEIDEDFLKAMEHGFPPMTGSGIGIDRLLAIITAQPNLRDVVLFPTLKPEDGAVSSKKKKEYQLAVALLNQEAKLEPWQQMNAMAHLTAAFGARHQSPRELFYQNTMQSADGRDINLNIQHAIMVKSIPTGADIKNLIAIANEQGVEVAEFTREMIETTDDDLVIKNTKAKAYDEVEHLGVLVFGSKKAVESLTKQYPLFS